MYFWKARSFHLLVRLKQKFQPINGESWKQFFISIYRDQIQECLYEKNIAIEQKVLLGNGGVRKYLYTSEIALKYQYTVTLTNRREIGWLALTSFPRLVFRTEGRKNQTISINILSSKTTVTIEEDNLLIVTASGEYLFKGGSENLADWVLPIKELVANRKIENSKTSGELLQCQDCGIIYKQSLNHIRACLYHPGDVVQRTGGLQWNCCNLPASKYWRFVRGCHLKNHCSTNKPFSPCVDPKQFFIF